VSVFPSFGFSYTAVLIAHSISTFDMPCLNAVLLIAISRLPSYYKSTFFARSYSHSPNKRLWCQSHLCVPTDEYRRQTETRAVKKTLSIPAWLNDKAEKANVPFSQILQQGLKDYLHVG
jgi:hypothetical protein